VSSSTLHKSKRFGIVMWETTLKKSHQHQLYSPAPDRNHKPISGDCAWPELTMSSKLAQSVEILGG